MSNPHPDFHREMLQAALTGELQPVLSLFADDAVLMPPNDSTLYGKGEVSAWFEEYFRYFRITSSVETERDTVDAGNQVFIRTAATVTIVPKERGARITDDVRGLTVWRREPDGSLKISHQMWNSTKPVGAGTNRYMTRVLQKRSTPRPASS